MLRPFQSSPPPLSPTMQPTTANSLTLKRKKWTEEEERSLIDKYEDMQSEGILARMRTREKKFRPIAAHVNARHHSIDPEAYPFLWSWKDASTKVQNMRHQYLLVKQKLLSSPSPSSSTAAVATEPTSCGIDWSQGLSLWPNFLQYRHVFGDVPLPPKPPDAPSSATAAERPAPDIEGNNVLGMGFECSNEDGGFDYEEAPPPLLLPPPQLLPLSERRKKKKRRKREGREWARISAALAELREREERLEERDQETIGWAQEEERERDVRDVEEGLRRREREDREWEERMEQRRAEWRKRMEVMMEQHRAEMEQIQTRVLHDQQSVVNQLIGVISHWVSVGGSGCGIGDITGMGGGSAADGQHYVSQMMQGLHHLNEMVTGENRVGSDGPEDQFIDDA
ncbi:hypothetical protein KSP39_PZI019224 [Platanthera zijinensis]|uniref:Uncharacterized protein n=1 Tax=Platanthera zijinensis TaxID=2320716 RepID=A0AAP0FXT5_9ASPA